MMPRSDASTDNLELPSSKLYTTISSNASTVGSCSDRAEADDTEQCHDRDENSTSSISSIQQFLREFAPNQNDKGNDSDGKWENIDHETVETSQVPFDSIPSNPNAAASQSNFSFSFSSKMDRDKIPNHEDTATQRQRNRENLKMMVTSPGGTSNVKHSQMNQSNESSRFCQTTFVPPAVPLVPPVPPKSCPSSTVTSNTIHRSYSKHPHQKESNHPDASQLRKYHRILTRIYSKCCGAKHLFMKLAQFEKAIAQLGMMHLQDPMLRRLWRVIYKSNPKHKAGQINVDTFTHIMTQMLCKHSFQDSFHPDEFHEVMSMLLESGKIDRAIHSLSTRPYHCVQSQVLSSSSTSSMNHCNSSNINTLRNRTSSTKTNRNRKSVSSSSFSSEPKPFDASQTVQRLHTDYYRNLHKKQIQREQLRKERHQKVMEKCTFMPDMAKSRKASQRLIQQYGLRGNHRGGVHGVDFVDDAFSNSDHSDSTPFNHQKSRNCNRNSTNAPFQPLTVSTNCILNKGLLCYTLERHRDPGSTSSDPRFKTSEQLELERYCTFTPKLKTAKSPWSSRPRESYPYTLYPEEDEFGNLITRTVQTMKKIQSQSTKAVQSPQQSANIDFQSDPDSQSPSPTKYPSKGLKKKKESRSYTELHEQRMNAKTPYKFITSTPKQKIQKVQNQKENEKETTLDPPVSNSNLIGAKLSQSNSAKESTATSPYFHSPQTQAKIKQFAANFSEAMNLQIDTPSASKSNSNSSSPKNEPDLFLSVNVNDNSVEQIALNANQVDVAQFVHSLSLKYNLSPHKATKIEQNLSRVIREAKQSDTMSVISIHTNTGVISEFNDYSSTPRSTTFEDEEEETEQIFINLMSP